MPRFVAAHPELRVDLQLTDSVVDIVAAGIDVAVRIGQPRDSSLIARRLAPNRCVLCAAATYLARAGAPRTLRELALHQCLPLSGVTRWTLVDNSGRVREARVSCRFASSSVEALHAACLGGLGLALLSEWDAAEELADGRLVEVALDAGLPQELAIWAIYPTSRLVPPKVRAFVAELERTIARD